MAIDVNNRSVNVLSSECNDESKNNVRPSQRVGCRMVIVEEKMKLYLFGGLNKENQTLNDMWLYDINAETWE